jgi:hypothetical protein
LVLATDYFQITITVWTIKCQEIPLIAKNIGQNKKNIEGRIAAPSFSAVEAIWLGHRPEQKTAQKACAAMSFSLFSLNFE